MKLISSDEQITGIQKFKLYFEFLAGSVKDILVYDDRTKVF